MKRFSNFSKTAFVAVAIMGLAACNGSDNNSSTNNPTPVDPNTGFTSFTLQNVSSDPALAPSNTVKIITSSLRDDESNIYFQLPKDATTTTPNPLMATNSLYPVIRTNANESVFIGNPAGTTKQLILNSESNLAVDLSTVDNQKLIITTPGQAIESGRIFTLHLDATQESSNIVIDPANLSLATAKDGANIALTEFNVGTLTSVVNGAKYTIESLTTLFPTLYFAESAESITPEFTQNSQAVPFIYESTTNTAKATYTLTSPDKKTTAIYTNTVESAASDKTTIFGCTVESSVVSSCIVKPNEIDLTLNKGETEVTGPVYLNYLSESLEITTPSFTKKGLFINESTYTFKTEAANDLTFVSHAADGTTNATYTFKTVAKD